MGKNTSVQRKIICLFLVLVMLLALAACKTKTVTCDGCGTEIQLEANSNVTDEWIVYCRTCEVELFGEDGVVSAD